MFGDLVKKKKRGVCVGINCPHCNLMVIAKYGIYGHNSTTGKLQYEPYAQAFCCKKCDKSWYVYYDKHLSPIKIEHTGKAHSV